MTLTGTRLTHGILGIRKGNIMKINEYEKACKEFLKGCSIAGPNSVHGQPNQEDCPDCLKAFCDHIRGLEDVKEESEKVDYFQSMQKLKIKDGDVIVLKCKQKLSSETAKHLSEAYQKAMEGFRIKDIKVLILEEGIDIGVITKGVKEKANG